MINLHESMGPRLDRICSPWISSQKSICSQTCYRRRPVALFSEINDRLLGCWNEPISAILNQHFALTVQFNPAYGSGDVVCTILTLNAAITAKVVCFSCMLKLLRSLYGKQCGPRSDCSYRSSLFWVHAVCFYT